ENRVVEAFPHRIRDVQAELDSDGPQYQKPEHHHQRQVKSTEAGGIELWEGEVKRAARREQPDLVAIPHRTDGPQNGSPLTIVSRGHRVDDAGSEIESVEHHVGGEHHRNDDEPKCFHQCASSGSAAGPRSISRRTRNRNRMPSTMYMPMKPSKVNNPFPAETVREYPSAVRNRP